MAQNVKSEEKYQNFSDSGMRDRVAAVHAAEYSMPKEDDPTEDPALQHSGFTSSGWDKYYFFSNPASCAGPGKGNLHPTARLGRNRPAMNGPQTFTIEVFTPQELKLARIRIEKKGARTTYAESYSQLPRSSTSVMGPIERPSGHRIMKQAAATGQSISDTLQQAGLGALNRSACQSFLPSLAWSMVLLGVFMSMGALIMGNLLQVFYLEASYPQEDRELIWNYYGTAYRSFWTLYEITFAGNWPTRARPVMEKVSQLFVVFFFCYVTVIVFAVLRVISAVFLKDTLDAAHNDEENMMAISQHQKKEYIERLEKVFRTLDEFGDGMITQPRLEQLLAEPKVQAYFKTLDVDVTETSALFHLLDDGDGEVTLDEFIDGILRCKGPARAIDQVAMHSDIKQLDKKLSKVMKAMRATSKPQKKAHLEEENMTCAHSHAEHLKVFRMGLLEGDHSFFERQKSPV